jgi:hypothetical protein
VRRDEASEPVNVEVTNPCFDYVPPHLVGLFVTDTGGYTPSYVYRLLAEYYSRWVEWVGWAGPGRRPASGALPARASSERPQLAQTNHTRTHARAHERAPAPPPPTPLPRPAPAAALAQTVSLPLSNLPPARTTFSAPSC